MATELQLTPRMAAVLLARKRRKVQALRDADPWRSAARSNQIAPAGDWTTWLIMAGRGFGKTRAGAEWVREKAMAAGKGYVIHLIGATAADVRDVMIEGESGILACCERYGFSAKYQPSRRRIVFGNGVIARCFSAEEPRRLRGPQCHALWADEVAAWPHLDAWDQAQFGLRLKWGEQEPQQVATTTPKPVSIVRAIVALPGLVTSTGSSYDNRENLAPVFFSTITRKYEGTRLGRQELEGVLLNEVEGALWNLAMIDKARLPALPWHLDPITGELTRPNVEQLNLKRIVVAIDPATTYGETADETAIAVVGVDRKGEAYLLDSWCGRLAPAEWGRKAIRLFDLWMADAVIAESNQGGEMIREVLRTSALALRDSDQPDGDLRRIGPTPPVRLIHAKRGKQVRAEPVSALYEQGRVHHVGSHPDFEDQMILFPVAHEDQDDRVDSLVHGIVEVAIGRDKRMRAA